MALYAFDGTWNSDEEDNIQDTNVARFKELYMGNNAEYTEGVGTRFGHIGKAFGGIFGAGGRTRIDEMYDELCENFQAGDEAIDIVGFSRGAALAVHFSNKICEEGIKLSNGQSKKVKIRFLGLWDIVGSFGIAMKSLIDFQKINLGWDIDTVHSCVTHCYHAMALDERRETFNVTRLDPGHEYTNIREVWFRGVHSDVGGGNNNVNRSNIALNWMLEKANECGLPINKTKSMLPRYKRLDLFAMVSENKDLEKDPRRKVLHGDSIHESADALRLDIGESHTCEVLAELKYNWSGVALEKGCKYIFSVDDDDIWKDASIECGAGGWESEQLPWYHEGIVKVLEKFRRIKDANWFALSGALGDEDETYFLIGDKKQPYTAPVNSDLYLFANDMDSKYGNNDGSLKVTITRTA